MEQLYKYLFGAVMAAAAHFAPMVSLILCAVAFVGVDFVSGVAASHQQAHRDGEEWFFRSCEAWRTIVKLSFVVVSIALAWLLDSVVLDFMNLKLANLFTGFVCGVEGWSILENASVLSHAPLFRYLQRYMRRRINKEIKK